MEPTIEEFNNKYTLTEKDGHIWTLMDDEGEGYTLVPGYHIVNNIGQVYTIEEPDGNEYYVDVDD